MKKKSVLSFDQLPDTGLVSEEHLLWVGLGSSDFKRITRLIGRVPTKIELAVVGALWSERACEKSSRVHLSKLYSPHHLATPIAGSNYALVQKIRSVGDDESAWAPTLCDMIGDIIAMGARPLALFHSFGLDWRNASAEQLKKLAAYCNALMVPSLVSDVEIAHCQQDAMASFLVLALLKNGHFCPKKAVGAKNRIFYVGQASDDFSMDAHLHCSLFAACSVAIEEGLVVGSASIGVAGLAQAAFSLASLGASGLLLHLDTVVSKKTLSAHQILLSETPGRMLFVVEPKKAAAFIEIFSRFKVPAFDIGVVNGDGLVRIMNEGQEVVHLAATLLLENAPRLRLSCDNIVETEQNLRADGSDQLSINDALSERHQSFFFKKIPAAALFDAHLGLNTLVSRNEADASLLSLPEENQALAVAMVSQSLLLSLSPHEGARRAFFEAALSLSAQGAALHSISCSLVIGAPEDEAVMAKFKLAIEALKQCALYFNVPISYAQTLIQARSSHQAGLMLSACGLSKAKRPVRYANAQNGDHLVMLGEMPSGYVGVESIFLKPGLSRLRSWDEENITRLISIVRYVVENGLSSAVSVLGRGGFYQSLLKVMHKSGVGLKVIFGAEWLSNELPLCLLSEESARVLLVVPPQHMNDLLKQCAHKVAVFSLGHMAGSGLEIKHEGLTYYEAK